MHNQQATTPQSQDRLPQEQQQLQVEDLPPQEQDLQVQCQPLQEQQLQPQSPNQPSQKQDPQVQCQPLQEQQQLQVQDLPPQEQDPQVQCQPLLEQQQLQVQDPPPQEQDPQVQCHPLQEQQHPKPQDMPPQKQQQPTNKIITKVKLLDEINLFEWLKADVFNQIADKAKSSVDQFITTLDPGMKEYLYTGGKMNVRVLCENDNQARCVRETFQDVYGRATVIRVDCKSNELALGLEEAILFAQRQISTFRLNTSEEIPQNQVVVAIQPAIIQLNETILDAIPKKFLTYCMLLEDPVLSLTLNSFSQFLCFDEYSSCRDSSKNPDAAESVDSYDGVGKDDLVTKLSVQIANMYKGKLKEGVA